MTDFMFFPSIFKSVIFFVSICIFSVVFIAVPNEAGSQSPFPGVPQAPQIQPSGPQFPPQSPPRATPQRGPVQPPQQMPEEYAFRPNLTNPEFGECLQLERNWKTLWNSYYQAYYHAQSLPPSDPQYRQMAAYVNSLRYQLDAAWSAFSQKCIYFPRQ